MSLKIKKFVDVDKPVDLHALKSWTRLSTAFRYWWTHNEIYDFFTNKNEEKTLRALLLEKQEIDSAFINRVLEELNRDSTLRSYRKEGKTDCVTLLVNRAFMERVKSARNSGSLSGFEFEIVNDNENFRLSRGRTQIMVKISKRIMNKDNIIYEDDLDLDSDEFKSDYSF